MCATSHLFLDYFDLGVGNIGKYFCTKEQFWSECGIVIKNCFEMPKDTIQDFRGVL